MTKLDFIPTGNWGGGPLIRLYQFEAADLVALREACLSLAEGRLREIHLHTQPWIKSVDGCQFILRLAAANRGAVIPPPGQPWVMEHTIEGWFDVAGRIQSMENAPPGHFNWLNEDGDVEVLLSQSGTW